MSTKRFNSRYYAEDKVTFRRGEWHSESLPGRRLYAQGIYPTNLVREDLPEWYLWGRYHKRWGWLCTKGITDMVYRPCRFSNHFLKDDYLMVSYGGKITLKEDSEERYPFRDYEGVDEHIWGSEILTVLRGARDYSGYDIAPLLEQLKEKAEWLRKEYPHEFGNFVFEPEQYGF